METDTINISTFAESFHSRLSYVWQDKQKTRDEIERTLESIEQTYHHQLQKAREEERERIEDEFAKVAKYIQDFESDAYGEHAVNTSYYQLYEGQWEYIIKPKDHPTN